MLRLGQFMKAKILPLALPGMILFAVCAATTPAASDDARRDVSYPPSATSEPQEGGGCAGVRVAMESAGETLAPDRLAALVQGDCSDSIADCKPPVKHTGSKGECACFACEYGKSTQHFVCTKIKSEKDTLFKKAQGQ